MRFKNLSARHAVAAAALGMTVSLAACGGGGDDDAAPAATTPATDATANTNGQANGQPNGGQNPFADVIQCLRDAGLNPTEPSFGGGNGGPPNGGSLPPGVSIPDGGFPGGGTPPDGSFPRGTPPGGTFPGGSVPDGSFPQGGPRNGGGFPGGGQADPSFLAGLLGLDANDLTSPPRSNPAAPNWRTDGVPVDGTPTTRLPPAVSPRGEQCWRRVQRRRRASSAERASTSARDRDVCVAETLLDHELVDAVRDSRRHDRTCPTRLASDWKSRSVFTQPPSGVH